MEVEARAEVTEWGIMMRDDENEELEQHFKNFDAWIRSTSDKICELYDTDKINEEEFTKLLEDLRRILLDRYLEETGDFDFIDFCSWADKKLGRDEDADDDSDQNEPM